jgi:multiple sugar transport system permease protein
MLLASFGVALILNKEIPGGTFFRVLYYIPVITSWVAGAMIWKWVLSPEYGVINNVLGIFGIKGPGWLQSPAWAMPGIVLASIWKDMGFVGLMLFAGLRGIKKEYYEAADIDGAGKARQLWHITLPLLSPVFFFIITVRMINAFQIFPQVMIMTPDGGPGGSTMVMVERVYRYAFRYYEMGYASALSWILFILILVLTLIQTRLQDRWVVYDT